MEIPLGYVRKLVSEIRQKEYSKESWESWYFRIHSGQLLRQAGTAACILNEMIFGMSDQVIDDFRKIFHRSSVEIGEKRSSHTNSFVGSNVQDKSPWKVSQGQCMRQHIIDCVGTILHEYITPEIWGLPVDYDSCLLRSGGNGEDPNKHFFRDVATLHQAFLQLLFYSGAFFNSRALSRIIDLHLL